MKNSQIPEFVREHLRDYILFVTRLNMGNTVQSIEEIQLLAVHFVNEFEQNIRDQKAPEHELKQIRYALFALVDEVALRFLDSSNRLIWESAPLQVTQFGEYDAGVQLFEDIKKELHKPDSSMWLLSVWNIVFSLGFKGQYLFDDSYKRNELIASINQRLPEIVLPRFTAARKLRAMSLGSFSVVFWCVILVLVTLGLYLGLSNYLDTLVDQIR